jgi:hypothetical protein
MKIRDKKRNKGGEQAMRPVPYKLVRVDWEDSARPISAWQWIDDYQIPEIVQCVSVGYLIADTSDALALAPNLGDMDRERIQACGIIRIPRTCVRGIREI